MNNVQTVTRHILQELKGGTPVESVLSATKEVLKKYKIETLYKSILQNLERQLKAEKEKQTFYIDTPFQLSEDTAREVVTHIVQGGTEMPIAVQRIEPELVAGFKVSYSGYVYDASAKKHINQLYNLK